MQHLYFYEDINAINKLVYLGLILNFIFIHFYSYSLNLSASVFAIQKYSFSKVENTNPFKISETQKIDCDLTLKQETRKNKSMQDFSSEASFVHWLRPIANFAQVLLVNDNDLCLKRCKMPFLCY